MVGQRTGQSMPRTLKPYIAGVVTLSAIALVVATLLFPVDPRQSRSDLGAAVGRSRLEIAARHRLLDALHLSLRRSRQTATRNPSSVALAPMVAAISSAAQPWRAGSRRSGRPKCGSFAGGSPGMDRSPITRAMSAGDRWRRCRSGIVISAQRPSSSDFVATMVGATVFFGLNVAIVWSLLALRTGQSFASSYRRLREARLQSLALAPLGWLMAIVYSIQWWATLLFALPLYTTRTARSGSSRSARCSPRRSGRWPRPWTSAIRTRRGTASGSRRSRSISGG